MFTFKNQDIFNFGTQLVVMNDDYILEKRAKK